MGPDSVFLLPGRLARSLRGVGLAGASVAGASAAGAHHGRGAWTKSSFWITDGGITNG